MKKSILIGLFLLIAFILIFTLTMCKTSQDEKTAVYKYRYVVKFICGTSNGEVLAQGKYFTAINVYNPLISFTFVPDIKKKFAIAEPHETPGNTSNFIPIQFPHDRDSALEIDCPDIFQHLIAEELIKPNRLFVKGFVIIESSVQLDVVAVYTAAGMNGEVNTLDIERVSPQLLSQ